MRLLLSSAGISNTSIYATLIDLLSKPIAESNALFIPTAIYPFPAVPVWHGKRSAEKPKAPLCGRLDWQTSCRRCGASRSMWE